MLTKNIVWLVASVSLFIGLSTVAADPEEPAGVAEKQLFAVEVTIGPNWDADKQTQEQLHFKEHSALLSRLRKTGHIVMGARYSDKGLLIFSALSADEVRALMDEDPSMAAGTFRYEVHDFNVFYPGEVK